MPIRSVLAGNHARAARASIARVGVNLANAGLTRLADAVFPAVAKPGRKPATKKAKAKKKSRR